MQISRDRRVQHKHRTISNPSLQMTNFISHDPRETQKPIPIPVIFMFTLQVNWD